MKTWWSQQHQATREACIMLGIAWLAILSLFFHLNSEIDPALNNPLLRVSKTYRISANLAEYSLLFQHAIPLIGNQQFQAIGRLKPSEAQVIQKSLVETQIIRNLGKAQLDIEQQVAYGFDKSLHIHTPGQEVWSIATGKDGQGYALDTDGVLYQLDRDLAGQLNRSPTALRANTLGLPKQLQRIQRQDHWTLGFIRDRWWLAQGESSVLADQLICRDWLKVFQETQAISFTSASDAANDHSLFFEGQSNDGQQVIRLCDRGPAPSTKHYRIIERQQQFADFILKEAFIIDINQSFFQFPETAFLSKHLIPFEPKDATSISLLDVDLQFVKGNWYLGGNIFANQQKVTQLIEQLATLPSVSNKSSEHVGKLITGSLEFLIPKTAESTKLAASLLRPSFADPRLFPTITEKDISGVVIQAAADVPQYYQRLDDGTWDMDPEIHAETKDFIAALAAARVSSWNQAYNAQFAWTSTLTVAIGSYRVILKKSDDHIIGIESANIQGRLDKDSIRDLFGP